MLKFKLRYLIERLFKIIFPPIRISPPSPDIIIEKDVAITMEDNIELKLNIFRPSSKGRYPVIISMHPYGKDRLPKKFLGYYLPLFQYRILRQSGSIHISSLTSWEAPDPNFWVQNGYVVINADARGYGKSSGIRTLFSDIEAQDYYNLIEWAAIQDWSNGKIGLNGVSYLAINQYKVAALKPPHLQAIIPWEGFSDFYRDLARPGGIREDGFVPFWSRICLPQIRLESLKRELFDEWYQSFNADLEKIDLPALICGSFSDQCLHSNGSFRAFNKIRSKYKWLYTHRGGKWCTYYSQEALSFQLKFFDYFLKNINNDILDIPSVRLETRQSHDQITNISYHQSWPIKEVNWQKLYLDPSSQTLNFHETLNSSKLSLDNQREQASFTWKVPYDLVLTGPMKLQINIELEECIDANIFVGIFKYNENQHIPFEGSYGFGLDCVTKGWLKASLRSSQNTTITPWETNHTFESIKLLKPKEIACLSINLLPSSTLFRRDEILKLNIQGHWLFNEGKLFSQMAKYESSTSGRIVIHNSSNYKNFLLVPILKLP